MKGMSDAEVLEFNRGVIDAFRAGAGQLPEAHPLHGNPTLLMTMTGARSGRTLTTPLTYTEDGDAFIVMASAGGDPKAPAWAFNLRAEPHVTLEVGTDTIQARDTETDGPDRERAFELMTTHLPRFADYQAGVDRLIPLFRLERI